MAYVQLTNYVPQWHASDNTLASGQVIKAYLAGTSTGTNLFTDSSGTSAGTSIALNARGEPEVSGNTVIPYLDDAIIYKLSLYPTQAAADADSGAIWTVDNINPASLTSSFKMISQYGDSLATAITDIGATETTLWIDKSISVTADATVPSNITLKFLHGGDLNISATKTVTVNGGIEAGNYQIFTGSGTVAIHNAILNVKWWGAKGDKSTDDSSAIDKASAASAATWAEVTDAQIGWNEIQSPLYFPPGEYVYSGTGIAQASNNIIWVAKPNTVNIRMTTSNYLMTLSGSARNTHVKGINFSGGKGYFKYTNTGNNVAGMYVYEDVKFDGYTEAAVGNLSDDMPYWKFHRCTFYGDSGGTSIGAAIGGLANRSCFRSCEFLRNKYDLKIGDRIGGDILIDDCSFFKFGSFTKEADIWFVPNTTSATSAGRGTVIQNSKFGNENIAASQPRLLIATEGSGTDRLDKHHSTTWAGSGEFIDGIRIVNNAIYCISGMTSPFIRSYINEVYDITYESNHLFGGAHTYLVEYMGTPTDDNGYLTNTIYAEMGNNSAQRAFSVDITNYHRGLSRDELGYMQGSAQTLLPGHSVGDDADFVLLAAWPDYADIAVFGGASKVTANDVYGTARGAEVTVSSNLSGGVGKTLTNSVTDGLMAWVELDLKQGSTQSLDAVQVEIFNFTTNKTALRRKVQLPTSWRTVRIPFVAPVSTSDSSWQLRIEGDGYSAGTKTKFQIGRQYVYHARQPCNINHLRTLDNGGWDAAHIVLGAYHLWVDSTGDLRIKSSAPTSDTDGTVVGAQS